MESVNSRDNRREKIDNVTDEHLSSSKNKKKKRTSENLLISSTIKQGHDSVQI